MKHITRSGRRSLSREMTNAGRRLSPERSVKGKAGEDDATEGEHSAGALHQVIVRIRFGLVGQPLEALASRGDRRHWGCPASRTSTCGRARAHRSLAAWVRRRPVQLRHQERSGALVSSDPFIGGQPPGCCRGRARKGSCLRGGDGRRARQTLALAFLAEPGEVSPSISPLPCRAPHPALTRGSAPHACQGPLTSGARYVAR